MKIETIKDRLQLAQDNQRSKFDEFNECDDLYNSKVKPQPGKSQVFNPRGWAAVEMLVPRVVAKKPSLSFLPREETDNDQSEILSGLFSYWWDKINGFIKLVNWVKTATIYGTGVAKVTWCTKKKTTKSYVLDEMGKPVLGEDGGYIVEEKDEYAYDDPEIEIVNPYHFYFNPGATDTDDAQWIIHEYWKPFKDIENENETTGIYTGLSQLKRYLNKKEIERGTHDDHRSESAGNNTKLEDSTVDNVHLVEMWDMLENKQYILAAGEVVILERENPYWHGKSPFIRLVDSIVPFEFYGKGELYSIKGLQSALNTIRNQRIDNVTQAINAMWKVRGRVNETELVWRPNGVVHVSDLDDAQLVEYPNMTQNAYEEEQYITAEMDHALGSADYTQIGDAASNNTATGMSIKAEQINSRFYHKIQLLEEMALNRLGEIVLALYQQYVTSEKVIRVVGDSGKEYKRLTPADIAGSYDCVVEAGSTQPVNKEKDKEEAVNLLSIMGQDPDLKPEGRYELKVKMLEKFGYKKAEQMLVSPEEQAIEMEMQQEQMMAQEQQSAEQQMMEQQGMEEQQMMAQQQEEQMKQEQADAEEIAHQRELEKILMKQGAM